MKHWNRWMTVVLTMIIVGLHVAACGSEPSPNANTGGEAVAEATIDEETLPEDATESETPSEEAIEGETSSEEATDDETPSEDATSGEIAAEAADDEEVSEEAADDSEISEEEFEDLEDLDPSNFDDPTNIDNEWWPLKPGTQYIYEGITVEDGEEIPHRIVFTVTDLTKVINDVRAVVVWDRDYSDDLLEESELAFFAQDNDGNVWHLGQYSETYDEVEFVGGRVWLIDLPEGAKAGIMMQAEPQLETSSYSQGYAPAPFNWTDRARVYQMGEETCVALDCYEDVLVIEEFNQEEPGAFQLKYYARGVGNVRVGWRGDDEQQETLELVEVVELDPEALAEVRAQALALEERAYMYSQTQPAEHTPGTEAQ